jgi:hypothetical protein
MVPQKPCSGARGPLVLAAAVACVGLSIPVRAAERLIDVRRSTITVRVFVESAAAVLPDHYVIQSRLSEGTIDEAIPHFQIVIDGSRLRVIAPGRLATERQQVESRILGPEGLDIDRYRWISFHSVTIDTRAGDEWLVDGELGMRGTVRSLKVRVVRAGNRYTGSATVKPADFGIAPATLLAPAVRLREDVQIDFDIVVSDRPA